MIELKTILETVENETGLKIRTHKRNRNLVYARYIYYRLAKEITDTSLDEIGKVVNRDHSTVINGLNKFEETILVDQDWYLVYLRIKQKFQGLTEEEREKIEVKDQVALLNQNLRAAHQKIIELQKLTSDSEILRWISLLSEEDMEDFKANRLKPYLMIRKLI
ncbi:helix-turn-helix domain-containing protein [Leeuwenhoekiella sp. ZYFB001]|uniref:helix-turn-helix domain-containing protein n=1 Tax=Leeuwenhoekiella sp. ZYFB001 TaxID=2719912 RepID=UPI00143124A4|nr:helix-turn-helix domain-containing protein [Leeuwenhoekiella sp. ZYFB001]